MNQNSRGISEEQQNDCRAALKRFIDRHELSDWGTTIQVQEATQGKYSLKIEITPPPNSGLPTWPIQEVAVADTFTDVAAKLDRMLELGYQARLPGRTTR